MSSKPESTTRSFRLADLLRPARLCQDKCKELQGREKEYCIWQCWEQQKAYNKLLLGD